MSVSERLTRLALELAEARDVIAVYRMLRDLALVETPTNGIFISSYDSERQLRLCAYAYSDGKEIDCSSLPEMPLTHSPHSLAVSTGEVQIVPDFDRAMEGSPRVDLLTERDPRLPKSCVVVPIAARGQVLGAFELQSLEPDAYRPEHVSLLRMAASLVGLAIENVGLMESERKGRERLEAQVARDRREQAVSRGLARRLVKNLARRGGVRPEILREMGRDLATGIVGKSAEDFVHAYSLMGLGTLRVDRAEGKRVTFTGEDLLEREEGATQPTCALALGFLEGAMVSFRKTAALGTEVKCQSMRHEKCVFIVAERE